MLSIILVVGVRPAFLARSFSASRASASFEANATVPSTGSQVTACNSRLVSGLLMVVIIGEAIVLVGIRATFPTAVATIEATMFDELGGVGVVALTLRVRLGIVDIAGLVSIVKRVVLEAELGDGISA